MCVKHIIIQILFTGFFFFDFLVLTVIFKNTWYVIVKVIQQLIQFNNHKYCIDQYFLTYNT